ncbi:MAG: hypothetical protein ACRYE7_01540 [Janthinobacterium lividum]
MDDTFPGLNGMPDRSVLDKIKFTMDILSEKYKGAGKMTTQEKFTNKVLDVDSLPSFTLINELVEKMRSELLINLVELEVIFNKTTMKLDISAKVIDGRRTNLLVKCKNNHSCFTLEVFKLLRFQTSKLWRKVTTAMATLLIFSNKLRIGVIQHLTLQEYEKANRGDTSVIWVEKHKTGDKTPANIVLDRETMDLMDRWAKIQHSNGV